MPLRLNGMDLQAASRACTAVAMPMMYMLRAGACPKARGQWWGTTAQAMHVVSHCCTQGDMQACHMLTQCGLDVLREFGVAKEAVKQVVAHKVCGIGTAMTCTGMATVRPRAKAPSCRQANKQ